MYHITEDVACNVENFYATKFNKLSIIHTDGRLSLQRGQSKQMNKICPKARWSIVVQASNQWLVSGDVDGRAILCLINNRYILKARLTLSPPTNSRSPGTGTDAIHSIRTIHTINDRSVMLATFEQGSHHLVAVCSDGLSLLQGDAADDIRVYDCLSALTMSVTVIGKSSVVVGRYTQTTMLKIKIL